MTCNYKNRIINPLHSRCTVIDFKIPNSEKPKLASQFLARLMEICNAEGIQFNEAVLAELIMKFFPDFRRVLNELQRYSAVGKIDVGVLANYDVSIDDLIAMLKGKKFDEMRKWVGENSINDLSVMYRKIFNALDPQSIPQLVLILADYQYKNSFVADHELNTVACLTEIMGECKFK